MSTNGTEEKLFQYADDNNPIILHDNTLNELFKELEINQKATGSKVNVAKTKGLWVRSKHCLVCLRGFLGEGEKC